MKDKFITIAAMDQEQEQWHVIIETPKGSCNKYKYDDELHTFRLAEVLPEGMAFPYDFGYLPSTLGDDGDPLDILLLMDQPTFCGCLVPSRLVGVIEGMQTERDGSSERNDRLVAIAAKTRRYGDIHSLKDLDKHLIDEIGKFFVTCNKELGKKFKILNTHGRHRAESLAKNGMRRFSKRHKRTKTSNR